MLALDDRARIAVIGAGPAGSLFSCFALEMASRVGFDLEVDVFEHRDFGKPGPAGCNMCGGIISESLVQLLAAEGIILPSTVVQRGIDSYVLHTEDSSVRIETPLHEKRIAAIHRGSGPRGRQGRQWDSFDGFLLGLACEKGANLIRGRVEDITWEDGRPHVHVKGGQSGVYDLVVGAVGVNSNTHKVFEAMGFNYRSPKTTKTFIAEFYLGQELITEHLGSSMHVFLLALPRLEFAALVPKGEYVTLCLLGEEIDRPLVDAFLRLPTVRSCFPADQEMPEMACHCSPHIYMGQEANPYADRVVLVGDCSVSRLYKNGIGAAYLTAKAAAVTSVFSGIAGRDFQRHFRPTLRRIDIDNQFGKVVFIIVSILRALPFSRRAVVEMVRREQAMDEGRRPMSGVLWDTFTGSAPYMDIFLRALRPNFLARLALEMVKALRGNGRLAPIQSESGLPPLSAGGREAG